MKKISLLVFLLSVLVTANAQISSRLLSGQAKPYRKLHPDNVLYVDTLPGGEFRIWAVTVDSILVKPHNMKWLKDSVVMIGNQRYVQLAGSYTNPSWVNSLSAGKVFGLSSVATTGDYNDLNNKPNLALYYLNSNPNGYISGITSSLVTGALGYTPISSSRTLTINGVTYDLTSNRSWSVGDILSSGSYSNPSWLTSLAYGKISGVPTAGTGISLAGNVITNTSPDQTVSLTAGSNISISGSYPSFTINSTAPATSIYTPARSLNSNFTISSTKQAWVAYSVTLNVTNPLLAGTSSATVFLEYSTNGGTNWTLVSQASNSSGVGVAVAIAINNIQQSVVSGSIPANALVRLRTTTSGTASTAFVSAQETY